MTTAKNVTDVPTPLSPEWCSRQALSRMPAMFRALTASVGGTEAARAAAIREKLALLALIERAEYRA